MPIKQKIKPATEKIVAELVDGGFETYVVGGAVRDLLLDLEPKDYDIATAAQPEQIRKVFGRRKARIIGRRFRLVHVYEKDDCYEVSTFRREPTTDERRERVSDNGVMLWRDNEYGSLEQDAKRRDFTVNALYYDPVGDKGIIDFVGGLEDLRSGLVQTIGDPRVRLEEDPVRMLRALKLVGQYGFRLEEKLASDIRAISHQIALASRARLFEELLKIVTRAHACNIFSACHEHGLLQHYWPNLAAIWEKPTGMILQRFLQERATRMAAGGYSTSKALALATVCLSQVTEKMGCHDLGDLWQHREGLEHECRTAIQEFFSPFPVSRYFTARVRDIIMLLPRLKSGLRKTAVMRSPEYKYGRELFSLVATVCGWHADVLDEWPAPEPTSNKRRSDGGRRRSRHSGRRRRPNQ